MMIIDRELNCVVVDGDNRGWQKNRREQLAGKLAETGKGKHKKEADIAVGLSGVYLNGMSGARSILFSPTA
ncbi:hypothetical protein CF105_19865 [Aeromonas veronii]|nr:hypothetical protein CF105_19865 [Aeromonas veronii]